MKIPAKQRQLKKKKSARRRLNTDSRQIKISRSFRLKISFCLVVNRFYNDVRKSATKLNYNFITFDNPAVNKIAFYFVHRDEKKADRDYSPKMQITHIAIGK